MGAGYRAGPLAACGRYQHWDRSRQAFEGAVPADDQPFPWYLDGSAPSDRWPEPAASHIYRNVTPRERYHRPRSALPQSWFPSLVVSGQGWGRRIVPASMRERSVRTPPHMVPGRRQVRVGRVRAGRTHLDARLEV